MSELDEKPFLAACKKRYGVADGEAEIKAAEFCSEWQEHLKDANWHPFKIQIINEDDEKLVGLEEQLGDEVYKAETTALLEIINEKLWNKKEDRKASMHEALQLVLNQWKLRRRRR
uniref:Factor of DNA methylation 1-5/IDN2 domain-containing protein n=1 Tax=Oryza meridionalis TaxID=40149 RepID=A0A0E0EHZ5_9ORYZ